MSSKTLISSIRLRNILSFGPESKELSFSSLNVFIGPNASGKSNLIEALNLLHRMPEHSPSLFFSGGTIQDWLWKGMGTQPIAEVETVVSYPDGLMPLRHKIRVRASGNRPEIIEETIENETQDSGVPDDTPTSFYKNVSGSSTLSARKDSNMPPGSPWEREWRDLPPKDIHPQQSILSQRRDPDQLPEITYLSTQYERMRFYRGWEVGPQSNIRTPQATDLPNDFLLDDGSNLALVLNGLEMNGEVHRTILDNLRDFYEDIQDYKTLIQGGTVQLFLNERRLNAPIPATRLSDGTLRFICLLTILCHPAPPPLICIEEPELGLHPDILPTVAKLLVEASSRTQLVVTTHSDILVSALSERHESVVVCERQQEGTSFIRLKEKDLRQWLESYSLGELWRMGEIGGTRW